MPSEPKYRFNVFSRITVFGKRWFFNMQNVGNNEIVLQSQKYKRKIDAIHMVDKLKLHAPTARVNVEQS